FDVEPSNRYFTSMRFSFDSQYLAVADDSVYTLPEGERVFDTTDSRYVNFSPDSTLVALADGDVYELGTWEQQFAFIEADVSGFPIFTENNRYLRIVNWGWYDLTTGNNTLIPVPDFSRFSPNGDFMEVYEEAIYSLETGEAVFSLEIDNTMRPGFVPNSFNGTQTHLAVSNGEQYVCQIYGAAGSDWAYRSGIVSVEDEVQSFDTPEGEENRMLSGTLVVFSQTEDGAWYRVTKGNNMSGEPVSALWIRADDVMPISMPEGIPIESP
ncbi:MAG: hypothetical protein AAFQ07_05405, partial [Chloroflexota bacterium]